MILLCCNVQVHPGGEIEKNGGNKNSATYDLSGVGISSAKLHNRPYIISNGTEFIGLQVESLWLWSRGLSTDTLECIFGLLSTLMSHIFPWKLRCVICLSSFISKLP